MLAPRCWRRSSANAQEKHYRFAHDQQLNSGYSVAYDIFSAKLKELSGGKMLVDQFPGAQLGQEPQLLQLVKSGDLDFAIVSSANTATISPQAGVMSLHFLFRGADHMVKALGDEKVFEAIRDMIDQTTQGIHVIGPRHAGPAQHVQQEGNPQGRGHQGSQDPRAGNRHRGRDLRGLRCADRPYAVRQRLHVAADRRVDVGENSVNVYLINKHYEPAPVLNMTEHEANNAILWISDKLWQSLSADQKKWVLAAGRDVSTQEPKKAFELEDAAATKLKAMGIKIVTDVDKSGFQKISNPMLDKLAKELGPHADKIKSLIVSIK